MENLEYTVDMDEFEEILKKEIGLRADIDEGSASGILKLVLKKHGLDKFSKIGVKDISSLYIITLWKLNDMSDEDFIESAKKVEKILETCIE